MKANDVKSQSPQIGALSPSRICGAKAHFLKLVSIPSNRGSVSVLAVGTANKLIADLTGLNPLKSGLCLRLGCRPARVGCDPRRSQSPQIGALSPSGS